MPSSNIYHVPEKDKWEFDQSVTDIFDDMLKRSIPQYEVMRETVTDIAKEFAVEGQVIVDLGCSRGDALMALIESLGGYCRYIGIDVSDPMLEFCRSRFERYTNGLVSIEKLDLRRDYPKTNNACVTISNLTLQFTPIEYRQQIVRSAYRSTTPGGCFILVEKIIGGTADVDAMLTRFYYGMKESNGYTDEEINRKRLSLEGVLVPVTSRWNEEILRGAGFSQVECFWRWMNFAGWLAIK